MIFCVFLGCSRRDGGGGGGGGVRAGAAAQQQVGGVGRRGRATALPSRLGTCAPAALSGLHRRLGAGLGVSRGQVQTVTGTENVQSWRRVGNARKTRQEVGNAVSRVC